MDMTVKQFCEMTGLKRITVTNAIKKNFPDKVKNGVRTRLNEMESTELLKYLRLKDLPNLSKNQQVEKVHNQQIDRIDRLENLVEKLVVISTNQTEQINRLLEQPRQKQIELKQDYFSLLGYMRFKGIDEARFSEMICYGKEASRISRELNKEIRKIPDERFGQVNSYHITVLERLFEI